MSYLVRLLTTSTVLMAACGTGEPDYRTIETLELGRATLVVEAAPGETRDAAALVRVRREGARTGVLYEGTLDNGGEPVGPGNFRPDASRPGHLWLCLNGSGQADTLVGIDLDSGLVIEDPKPCRD